MKKYPIFAYDMDSIENQKFNTFSRGKGAGRKSFKQLRGVDSNSSLATTSKPSSMLGNVKKEASYLSKKAQTTGMGAGSAIKNLGSKAIGAIKKNPLAAGAVAGAGIGAGLLAKRNMDSNKKIGSFKDMKDVVTGKRKGTLNIGGKKIKIAKK